MLFIYLEEVRRRLEGVSLSSYRVISRVELRLGRRHLHTLSQLGKAQPGFRIIVQQSGNICDRRIP